MKLYPLLRYKDARAAQRWLREAVGFVPVALHEDDSGEVAHAEMRGRSDLIMFGTAREDRYGERVGQGWVYATCEGSRRVFTLALKRPVRSHDGTGRPVLRFAGVCRPRPRRQPLELRHLPADVVACERIGHEGASSVLPRRPGL